MSPNITYDILSIELTVPTLVADGVNWPMHRECVMNAITSKKYWRHLTGTMHKLVVLIKCKRLFCHDDKSLVPLSNDQADEIEDVIEK